MHQAEILDENAVRTAEEYRRRKATSVLAVMFTDIAGSTELREQLGEVTYELQREAFDRNTRNLVEAEGAGAIVKSTGDGAFAVFAEPSTAVMKALALQAMLRTHNYFRLRIGLDMGQVAVTSQGGIVSDVFGRQVNRAARIQSIAAPEHVLSKFSRLRLRCRVAHRDKYQMVLSRQGYAERVRRTDFHPRTVRPTGCFSTTFPRPSRRRGRQVRECD